jgi:type III pantothenate kinase
MWLLFDIGTTSTKIGAYSPDVVGYDIITIPTDAADEDALVDGFVGAEIFNRAVLSSVVPVKLKRYAGILTDRGIDTISVSAGINLPFKIGYRTPDTLGADRIAGAAGALAYVRAEMPGRKNVVSVDAGTAVTFDIVSADGTFLGGPIAPGPELLRKAVASGTATLPTVDLYMPESVVTGSSEDAVRAGIMVGFVEGALGILRQINDQLEGETIAVFSGGWGQLLASQAGPDAVYRSTNMLDGLVELLGMN